MEIFESILKLLAGIGLFLFAMYLLEESLKNISGRNFKLFLQKMTKNSLGAVGGGAIVTGILQSSSMVSLMVLAFVGAGVFTLKNALAIILGANLGTTLDSWLVATLGFNSNIELIAYPIVFIGGLMLIIFGKRKSFKYIAYFMLGFGLLFIALALMKTAMEHQVKSFDLTQFSKLSGVLFLLIGFLITLLVQSSSVTMALALTALHAGAITFPAAAAIVLGSETGTTIKIMLGSLGGTAAKKRVALGNLFFNLFLTVFAFSLLKPLLFLIVDLMKIEQPVIGLVTFSTLINLVSILIFLPFLNPFVKFLGKFYKDSDADIAAYIGQANVSEPQTAFDLFYMEVDYFIHNSMLINLEQFGLDTTWLNHHSDFHPMNIRKRFYVKTLDEKYDFMKHQQGEIQAFYIQLRSKLKEDEYASLTRLVASARSAMLSVKSIKDIRSNITNLERSSKNIKFELLAQRKLDIEALYLQLYQLLSTKDPNSFEILIKAYHNIQDNYTSTLDAFYKDAQIKPLEDMDITTAISFNRELFTADKAILMSVKDLLLDEKKAEEFNTIPEYKT